MDPPQQDRQLHNKRILIDNDSSADILFWKAFTLMEIDSARIQLALMPLNGFSGETVQLARKITLSVLAGNTPCMAPITVDFLVVKALSSYNTIISQPTLNKLKAITSSYQLNVKFPTAQGIGEI